MQIRLNWVWLLIAIVFCASLNSLLAQNVPPSTTEQAASDKSKPPFTLKTSSRLVLVDVVAINGKGEPVTDLTAEDFVVREDGQPQTVRNFSFQQPPALNSGAQTVAQELPAGVVTNLPRHKQGNIWNVILLDALNSPMIDQSRTRQQLLDVINKIPDQPAAIYILTDQLHLLQDFSTDPAALKRVVAGLNNKGSALVDNPKGGHEAERYNPIFWAAIPASARAAILRDEAEITASHTRNRLQITLGALSAIAGNLKLLPGRKNLIWVSEGFPFSIEPGATVNAHESVTGRDYTVAIAATANALFDSQVAIYPIDSRGIITSDVYDPASRGFDAMGRKQSQVGVMSTVSEENNNLDVTHTSMQEIAERTGGKAFYNKNEIGNAIVESMNDGASFYTLAYSPTNRDLNGKFRHISIKSQRSGVKLRYRLGYFAIQPDIKLSPQQQAAIFEHAMDINSPSSTAILFRARVFSPSAKTQDQVLVNYLIPASGLAFTAGSDQLQHASVNCAIEAYSKNGEPFKKDGTTLTAALPADAYEKVVREGLPCQEKLKLPPGDYVLRLGIRDNTTGAIGSLDTKLSIPANQSPE